MFSEIFACITAKICMGDKWHIQTLWKHNPCQFYSHSHHCLPSPQYLSHYFCPLLVFLSRCQLVACTTNTRTALWPFVRNYPDEPVPEEISTHSLSWSSTFLYQLLPSTTIHSMLPAQFTCLSVFFAKPLSSLSSTSWPGALCNVLMCR